MLTLGTQTTDFMTRFAGSAHTRADMSQGDKTSRAKEDHVGGRHGIGGSVVDGEVSQQDKDVLLNNKLQRVHRILNVELSVNLSANFHRTQGPTPLPIYSEPQFDSNVVIDNVMSFIKDRLEDGLAEGKTGEELAKLLEQAEAGVAKGIAEAADALEHMGLLDGDVTQGVVNVESGLNQAIQELNSYLLEQLEMDDEAVGQSDSVVNPVAQQTIPLYQQVDYSHTKSSNVTGLFERFQPTGLSSGVTSIERSGARSYTLDETFEFEIRTNDGDIIRLNIGRGMSHESSFGAAYSEQSNSYTNISYSIDGDLDEDELAALDELFFKVNKLADSFFSGHIEQAFKQAMRLDYDSTELAGFSLNLSQTQTMAETYREIAQLAEPVTDDETKRANVFDFFQPVGHFVRDIMESMQEMEERSAFDHVGELVAELLGKAVAEDSAVEEDDDEVDSIKLGAYIQDFLSELGHYYNLMSQLV